MTHQSRVDHAQPLAGEEIASSQTPDWADQGHTLVALLMNRALHRPNRKTHTFLVDGDEEGDSLTFGDLDRRARAIAAQLQKTCQFGDRALLLYPSGLDYIEAFFGCLYAGVVAVPAYPPDPGRLNRSLPRLKVIAADAGAKVALTTSGLSSMGETLSAYDTEFGRLHWLASDSVSDALAEQWMQTDIHSETIAFLQYTSGSTADPKGVMVSHKNILYNMFDMAHSGEFTDDDTFVTWLPVFHDAGLIFGLLLPVYVEAPCYLMSPLAFLQRPLRWLRAISHYKGSASCAPNFAYELCVRKITPEQRATLDLSSWNMAANGAEPVRAETLERFTETFSSCGFRWKAFAPGYGLAEATLHVCQTFQAEPYLLPVIVEELEQHRVVEARVPGEGVRNLAGSGRTFFDTRVLIVDPESRLQCSPDAVGEIWVSGTTVAQGYWNRPEETQETFQARLADTGEGPFLRTGDLGFVRNGITYVTGRIKDMIIIDGLNHYPQDIERTVELSHKTVRPGCVAAFSVDADGEERLVVVVEAVMDADHNSKSVIAAIRKAIAEGHDLRVHKVCLIAPRSIDKTSSGKIQRQASRRGFLEGTLEVLAEE